MHDAPFLGSYFRNRKFKPKRAPYQDWASFVTWMQQVGPRPASKFDLDAWAPARFPAHAHRVLEAVIDVHAFVLDVDHVTPEQAAAYSARFEAEGLTYLVYTTWSHGWTRRIGKEGAAGFIPPQPDANEFCLRFVLPLTTPIPGAAWAERWQAAYHWATGASSLEGLDGSCKDSCRLYFRPFQGAVIHAHRGERLFDLAALPPAPFYVAHGDLSEGVEEIAKERLQEWARRARKSENEAKANAGRVMTRVLDGEAFADPGQVHDVIGMLSRHLSRAFPDADPDALAQHFEDAERNMQPGVVEHARQWLRRDLPKARAERDERESVTIPISSTSTPISSEAVALAKTALHAHYGDATSRLWVIQKASTYYFRDLVRGGYQGPYASTEAMNAASQVLAPAELALRHSPKHPLSPAQRKSLVELVDDFGTVASRVVVHLGAPQSRYEPTTQTMIEAPCPVRYPELQPTFDPTIDEWLARLTLAYYAPEDPAKMKRYRDVCTWLSRVTDLSRPLAALVFTGAPGVGKGSFANHLAAIWNRNRVAVDAMDVIGTTYNEALLDMGPVLFADEELPLTPRGRPNVAALKKIVSEETRSLRRKYVTSATIKGHLRLIVGANNDDLFATADHVTREDVSAVTARFYHVPVGEQGSPEALATEHFVRSHMARWKAEESFARHAMALVMAAPPEDLHSPDYVRFGITSPESTPIFQSLATRSGLRGDVCQVLVSWLDHPSYVGKVPGIFALQGDLYVSSRGVAALWEGVHSRPAPSHRAVGDAIKGLAARDRQRFGDGLQEHWYRPMDLALLARYSERTDGGDGAWLARRLLEVEASARDQGLGATFFA